MVEAIAAARDAGAAILCLPELCISGYGCEDAFFSAGVQQMSLRVLAEILPDTKGLAVAIGLPLRYEENLYNTVAWTCDGRLIGFVCKQHLAGDGIHYEPRWFSPWPADCVGQLEITLGDRAHDEGARNEEARSERDRRGETSQAFRDGASYPIGDLLFDCSGIRIGIEICRDAWVEDRPGRGLAQRGADILLNPSASHFAFAKQQIRRQIVLAGSGEFQASYVYANLLGNESGRAIYDGGTMIASEGKMLAEGPRFSYADFVLTTADVEVKKEKTKVPQKKGSNTLLATIDCGHTLPAMEQTRPPTQPAAWDNVPPSKEEEFARAVPLALFDYLRKSRAGGLVVSLSGGADSAAVAALVWLMVRFGVNELGSAALIERLGHIPALREESKQRSLDEMAIVHDLLTCIYQATRNSGKITRAAAREVATAIGAEFLEWNVDSLVDTYVEIVSKATGRALDWAHDDLALQNIQARARGPAIWLLANLRGALLLATSNRSEAAVGYATMDGDTCGGLAPIAGIDKAFLLEWLRWLEQTGPQGIGPLPALAVVNAQRPTAELRPPDACQTDESDLMPYLVLDAIERAAIRDKQTPREVFATIRPLLPAYSPFQLGQWVERFFRLWCRNQWKRERYAPSFHLDDENLDPKTWCRFPILSGGYQRELAELREYLATLEE
jgi:NAD+ synthase (glutamine-hydrolysing)